MLSADIDVVGVVDSDFRSQRACIVGSEMLEPVEVAVGRNFKHDNVVDRASGKSLFYGRCVVVGVNDVKN